MNFKVKRILQHVLFWLGIIAFYLFSSISPEQFQEVVETTFLKLPLLMAAAYFLNYWQVPQLLKKQKYWLFAASMLVTVLVLVLLFRMMGFYHLDEYCSEGPYPLLSWEDVPLYMLSFHFPAMIMYFYKTVKTQEFEKNRIHLLEKEKVETELKYLKAQLNPHFLFNTLNNLYSFVIDKSPKAPEMVLQLSEILDFILYKSRLPFVFLQEEIHTIENYIALERIKYGSRLNLTFTQNIDNGNQKISPLVLLSIVENAFKHGVRESITKPIIEIKVSQKNARIEFSVWNTKVVNEANSIDKGTKDAIGLVNIRRQLDLIYPNQHELTVEDTPDFFSLKLVLNTTNND